MTPARLTTARLLRLLSLAMGASAACILLCPLVGVSDGSLTFTSSADIAGDGVERLIYLRDRLPRSLAAAIVGGGLAAAGCTFQAVLRNPLAEPFTLGISSGASLMAVLAIRFGAGATFLGESVIGLAALLGERATDSP